MKRVAFTIVLNGVHHLKHNDFAEKMAKMFDYWVIVEGACGNNGSTKWCNATLDQYHANGYSIDGTTAFLHRLSHCHDNVHTIRPEGVWRDKDQMVNIALGKLSYLLGGKQAFLWEVDVDEQWEKHQLNAAELELLKKSAKTGMFKADYFVGPGLVVRGDWGEGGSLPYNRLWLWDGQEMFDTHEPPVMAHGNEPAILLPQRFKHYAYHFEKDVEFKDKWYGGHGGILEKWKQLQARDRGDFPVDISELTPFRWGSGATTIEYVG